MDERTSSMSNALSHCPVIPTITDSSFVNISFLCCLFCLFISFMLDFIRDGVSVGRKAIIF